MNGKTHPTFTTRLPAPLITALRREADAEGLKLYEYIRRVLIAGRDALRKKGDA